MSLIINYIAEKCKVKVINSQKHINQHSTPNENILKSLKKTKFPIHCLPICWKNNREVKLVFVRSLGWNQSLRRK